MSLCRMEVLARKGRPALVRGSLVYKCLLLSQISHVINHFLRGHCVSVAETTCGYQNTFLVLKFYPEISTTLTSAGFNGAMYEVGQTIIGDASQFHT